MLSRSQAISIAAAMMQCALDLHEVLQLAADGVVQELGCNTALIFLLDDDQGAFTSTAVSSRTEILDKVSAVVGFPLLRCQVPANRDFSETISNLLDGRATIKHDFYELVRPFLGRSVCLALQGLQDSRSFLAVPLRARGEMVGGLVVSTREEPGEVDIEKLMTFANLAATAIQNAQLYGAECAARDRLRDLVGYLETVREEERTRIAREIHDEFGQALTALKMDVAWLAKRLPADRPRLVEKASDMSELISSTIQAMRRVATDLRPGVLDHLGLVAAIEWQAQELSGRAGFDCELLLCDEDIVLDPDLATALFRIFQEILTNVACHSEATRVRVELREGCEEMLLIVRDDGKGISQGQALGSESLGVIAMEERARSWGGDIRFQAIPGQGTTVTVRMPRKTTSHKEGAK